MSYPLVYLHTIGLSSLHLRHIDEMGYSHEEAYARVSRGLLVDLGVRADRIDPILSRHASLRTAEIDALMERHAITIITVRDTIYPALLRQVPGVPYLLYVRGQIPDGECLGIVGSRQHTDYSRRVLDGLIP